MYLSFFPSRYFIFRRYLMEKEATSLLTGKWSFMWFYSSEQIEMLWKIIGWENFLKNVRAGICLNKISSLCCTNCNSTIIRIYCRFICSLLGFCKIALYRILEKFLRDIFFIFVTPYLKKLQTYALWVSTLLKKKCLEKTYRNNFQV